MKTTKPSKKQLDRRDFRCVVLVLRTKVDVCFVEDKMKMVIQIFFRLKKI